MQIEIKNQSLIQVISIKRLKKTNGENGKWISGATFCALTIPKDMSKNKFMIMQVLTVGKGDFYSKSLFFYVIC